MIKTKDWRRNEDEISFLRLIFHIHKKQTTLWGKKERQMAKVLLNSNELWQIEENLCSVDVFAPYELEAFHNSRECEMQHMENISFTPSINCRHLQLRRNTQYIGKYLNGSN